MLRVSSGYIAYAPIVRESLLAHGFSDEKVIVAPNTEVNSIPVRPEEKTGSERGVLFLGRLRKGCRVNLLIRALKKLREEERLPLTLNIVGSGEEEEPLRREAAHFSWVTWHGGVYDPLHIRKISLDCFVGCYPGNAGLSVVHLLSLSLPVVIHDDRSCQGPEASFVQTGVSGLVYDHTKPQESLYQALKSLAQDPRTLAKMQQSTFEEYQTLTNPSLAERLSSIFGNAAAASETGFLRVRSRLVDTSAIDAGVTNKK
jgi:glycosyltransferase involved in cell wall biosynthesis